MWKVLEIWKSIAYLRNGEMSGMGGGDGRAMGEEMKRGKTDESARVR